VIEIGEADFDAEVLRCELPVVVCFTTRWCHDCFPTCLLADQLVQEYHGRARFVKVDTERNPRMAERYRVIAVPTIILFHNARPLNRLVGFHDRNSLRSLVDKAGEQDPGVFRPGTTHQSEA